MADINPGGRRCTRHAACILREAGRAGGVDAELDVWKCGGAEVSACVMGHMTLCFTERHTRQSWVTDSSAVVYVTL